MKETVLLNAPPADEPQRPPTFPDDGPISEQIADRLHFSKYLISPARSSYNRMFDATTIAFVALHTLLEKPKKLAKLALALQPNLWHS